MTTAKTVVGENWVKNQQLTEKNSSEDFTYFTVARVFPVAEITSKIN